MRISDCSSDVCSSDLASAGCAGEDGTAGEVAEGTAASPVAGGGAAGTSDIRPRSCWTRPGCEVRVTCQAMNRVMAKNTIASHLVALDRKFDEPREPNTVAEAPPPKPVPACAPEPRCIRISAIIEIATSTNNTLRTNINIGWTLGGGFPAGNRSMDSGSRRLGEGQEIDRKSTRLHSSH